jgi:prophage regulatory protein
MRLLREPEVRSAFGFRSTTSIYNSLSEGLLTKPIRIGQRAVAWPENEIETIIGARISGKTDEQIKQLVSELTRRRVMA